MTDLALLKRARADVGVFAELLAGAPLWDHQLEIVRSPARIRVVCSGRQAGKSRTLALLALHAAFSGAGRKVLILSAGDDPAKDLLAEISLLAGAPLLAGSVVDDEKRLLTLSNGSTIRSIPASEKQARGPSVDLLILDEACYIDDDIWRAVRYTTIARPGSRVVMASTPRGKRDRFFATHFFMAKDGPVNVGGITVESFHWPSSVSPLVDMDLVELWRRTDPPRIFRTEVLAEWVDEAGAYFTADELDEAIAAYELIRPETAGGQLVAGGVDWGFSVDSNALVLVGVLSDDDLEGNVRRFPDAPVFFVPWLEEHKRTRYAEFIERIVDVADEGAGAFRVYTCASETNGVGEPPTQMLSQRAWERRTGMWVSPVHTDNRRKESMFGAIKLLLQQGRLVLPRHPGLLRQLEALEFETLESGAVRIAVPEAGGGHDDLAMALGQAMSCLKLSPGDRPAFGESRPGTGELLVTGGGTQIRERPRCAWTRWAFSSPKGKEGGDGW